MRNTSKKWLVLSVGFIAVVMAIWRWMATQPQPDVRVLITGYRFTDSQLTITALATNQGSVGLLYHCNPAYSEVHWEGPTKWGTSAPPYLSKWSSGGELRPGKSLEYSFTVPDTVRRFRVRCFFDVLSIRDRAFEAGWSSGIFTKGSRLSEALYNVTAGERREIEVDSDEVVVGRP
jgi:hypothetical protein